jgi:MSHA pilin protein MshC
VATAWAASAARINRKAMRGFTLIELLACLVILAVSAAIGGADFLDTQPFDQRGYADEVAAALRYAQGVAVASQCNVSFTINTAGYSAKQRAPAAGNTCATAGSYAQAVARSDGTSLAGTHPSDANVTAGATIVFGSLGQVTSGVPPTLTIGSITVAVDANSGFVTVQ